MRLLPATVAATFLVPTLAALPVLAHPAPDLRWQESVVDPDQSYRGLDAVDRSTAWISGGSASGGSGSVWRTTDGGASWQDVSPPDAEGLSFRDVEARNATTAVVLAIGFGEASRVYRTTDGGATWAETFRNTDDEAFYNCLDFYPGGKRGLAVSDPVDGKFRLIATDDGGQSWRVLPDAGMPDASGEANFSASGECLVIEGKHAWFGSGGAASRVFHSTDRGLTWQAADSTIPAGEAAGVFGLAVKNSRQAVAVGGNFAAPADGTDASAYSTNGRTWTNGGDLGHLGEDAAWFPGTRQTVLVVGESGAIGGSSVSHDGGRTWAAFSESGYHTLDCTADKACWAAGGGGRVAVLSAKR